jgi:perosamine synthetase
MSCTEQTRFPIPYGRQWIEEEDIDAVVEVLRSDWLTTGPKVEAFERAVAEFVGAREAVAVSSGTAALHAAMYAIGIGPGDEVILPPMTFVSTANAVLFQGGTPVFVDVDPDTLLLDPARVKERITPRTKAIVAVDYAGQPCDYDPLRDIARSHRLFLIADACHSLGATYKGQKVGTLADLTVFSFHPVKHITTGEGGMVLTDNPQLAARMRAFRNHGIDLDSRQRAENGTWYYEIVDLGYNYRITDFQSALGQSQLHKIHKWISRRQAIAHRYDSAFAGNWVLEPLRVRPDVFHVYHLYVVRLAAGHRQITREGVYETLRSAGMGVNVHYIPVHLHPYYREHLGTAAGMCPAAEAAYERILSLPIFPLMADDDVEEVISVLSQAVRKYLG